VRQNRKLHVAKEIRMLKGKSALVTGSTSGIGEAIARALAKAGANVMLNGFGDGAAIERQRAGMAKDYGVKVAYSGADMTKPAEIAAMVKAAEQEFGALDILVNNAGIQHVAKIEDFPIDRCGAAGDEEAQVGAHHQHRLDARTGGQRREGRLCGGQARHRRAHQGDRDRGGE
jgi:NAD(P)-dependent dehydrogenase (short-subunit alcohol dehydrogenase family)